MHLFEPLAHQLERFAEPLLECALQFLVNGCAHLVDLLRVVLLELFQTQIDRRSHLVYRSAQFLALRLGCDAGLLPVSREFVTKEPVDRFQSLHDVLFNRASIRQDHRVPAAAPP